MGQMNESLWDGCRSGNVERNKELVAAGHSPDDPLDSIGTTPLMAAATLPVVDLLLNMGASLSPTRFGQDILQVGVSDDESEFDDAGERLAAARMLIEHGAPLDRRNEHDWSRLCVASFESNVGAVEALVALGADPNDEPPPLGAACWGRGDDPAATTRIIEALLAAGAAVHRRDGAGWSLLHAAAMPYSHGDGLASSDGPNVAAMHALISHGVAPDIRGPDGITPLMLVAGDGAFEAVDALLVLGSDPSVRDDQGDRAYDHARSSEQQLTDLLETAPVEALDPVRAFRDRARRSAERLAAFGVG